MSKQLEYLNALASFDLLGTTKESPDGELLRRLRSAYIKLDSIKETIMVCQTIHSKLPTRTTEVLREWVSIIKAVHPSVWKEINDLEYFKPVSEEVGARTLGYSPDTPSLQLQEWKDAKPIRKTILSKVGADVSSMVESAYSELSDKLSKGLPGQFYVKDQKWIYPSVTNRQSLEVQLKAHDFYVAGDIYYRYILDDSISDIKDSIINVLKDAIRLIKHIPEVNTNVSSQYDVLQSLIDAAGGIEPSVNIENTVLKITPEPSYSPEENELKVNMKSDRYQEPIQEINDDVLVPERVINE